MNSYECRPAGVELGSARALAAPHGPGGGAAGRPYSISGHVMHGRKLGRDLGQSAPGHADGFRTLNLRFGHARPAAMGIFAVQVHGLADEPVAGVASLGLRPTVDDSGRVLLETHCFEWPAHLGPEGGYGKLIRVELLHKLRDEARYDGLDALTEAIRQDAREAQDFLAAHAAQRRQTTRDRIKLAPSPRVPALLHRSGHPIRKGASRVQANPSDTKRRHDRQDLCHLLPGHAESARHAVSHARRPAQARNRGVG